MANRWKRLWRVKERRTISLAAEAMACIVFINASNRLLLAAKEVLTIPLYAAWSIPKLRAGN